MFSNTHRAQYFQDEGDGITFLEKALNMPIDFKKIKILLKSACLEKLVMYRLHEPEVPPCENWGTMEKLAREKEVVGIYISGHPLDDFKLEMQNFCNGDISDFR